MLLKLLITATWGFSSTDIKDKTNSVNTHMVANLAAIRVYIQTVRKMQIMKFIDVEGNKFLLESLPEACVKISQLTITTQAKIHKLNSEHAIITRAKNAYIEDLKGEVVEAKSGLDIAALFSDD
tara:strand:+ start:299 stop:670 length:372 start_codon:yes stop_codon:yes gene_type:complete